MKKFLIFFVLLAMPFILNASILFTPDPKKVHQKEESVKEHLEAFAQTWNQGDINTVVSTFYKNSPKTVLITDNILKGYDAVLNFFQTNYPTSKEMGQISFSEIQVTYLDHDHCLALGKWSSVTSDSKHFGGTFTAIYELTYKKKEGWSWKIVVDHHTTGL